MAESNKRRRLQILKSDIFKDLAANTVNKDWKHERKCKKTALGWVGSPRITDIDGEEEFLFSSYRGEKTNHILLAVTILPFQVVLENLHHRDQTFHFLQEAAELHLPSPNYSQSRLCFRQSSPYIIHDRSIAVFRYGGLVGEKAISKRRSAMAVTHGDDWKIAGREKICSGKSVLGWGCIKSLLSSSDIMSFDFSNLPVKRTEHWSEAILWNDVVCDYYYFYIHSR